MRDISLLGGTGFIGEYLTHSLQKRKDCKVSVISSKDVLTQDSFKKSQILVVLTQPNLGLLKQIEEFVSSSKNLEKIVYLSSLLIYPDSNAPQGEEVLPKPLNFYEKEKYKEEKLLSRLTKKIECKLCIARLSNVYGDVKNKGIVNNIIVGLIKNQKIVINGDPAKKIRDYLFVEDVVNLISALIFNSQENQVEVYNICSGVGVSIDKLIEIIEDVSNEHVKFKIGKQIKEKSQVIGLHSKVLNLLDYKIKYDLKKGLKKTF